MRFNDIAYTIIKLAQGGGIPSDDSRLNPRQVYAWVAYYRAKLMYDLKEKLKKDNQIDQYVQDLGCIKLVCVDKADCCDGAIKIYDFYKKLEKPLPKLLPLPGMKALYFVGLIDKVTSIPVGNAFKAKYQKYDTFAKRQRFCWTIGQQVYFDLPPTDDLEYVNIRAIFENPEDANAYTCGGIDPLNPCVDGDAEYPIPGYLIQPMMEAIMKNELNLTIKTSGMQDTRNDGQEIWQSKVQR